MFHRETPLSSKFITVSIVALTTRASIFNYIYYFKLIREHEWVVRNRVIRWQSVYLFAIKDSNYNAY